MVDQPTLNGFIDELASAAPTPGGGGAAAVMGSMGAALIAMVANLTIGKKGFENIELEMRAVLSECEALRVRMLAMVEHDAMAFASLMAGYRLPKSSEIEKGARSDAIQAGLKAATLAPLACARAAAEGMRLADRAVALGHPNVISDVGVGLLASWAALRSAALNVSINVPQIKDTGFVDQTRAELHVPLAECTPMAEAVLARVNERIG